MTFRALYNAHIGECPTIAKPLFVHLWSFEFVAAFWAFKHLLHEHTSFFSNSKVSCSDRASTQILES